MFETDIYLLTDSRYVHPVNPDAYVSNILLEDSILIAELEKRGLSCRRVDWADPEVDWSRAKIALFRTTWDYFDRIEEFKIWLDRTENLIRFINPISTVRWNMDKHYLLDLEEKGVNIVPTRIIKKGTSFSLQEQFSEPGWEEMVMKPAISGAGRHTYRIRAADASANQTVLDELLREEDMLLQPFQQSVLESGEVALMIFNGQYTHSVLKIAKKGEFRVQDDFGGTIHPYQPNKEEIEFAIQAVKACTNEPLYARVDMIRDNSGRSALAELELIEPELWFRMHPPSAAILADAIISVYF